MQQSKAETIYSVIDLETTGGSDGNRITEIAIIKTNGKEIIDKYVRLVNPQVNIPRSISLLTGITNEMVEHEPIFDQIVDEVTDFLKDTIFVAHNSSFDYTVLKKHYYDLGLQFSSKKLCTVRLSKKIIPDLPSYSLGKLCQSLGIEVTNRHRAEGDAIATVALFHLLLQKDEEEFIKFSLNLQSKETTLPPHISREMYDALPEKEGVYYFKNEKHKILYVGKAINIKKRINTHFGEKTSKKAELLKKTHYIDYQLTGNELLAYLIEVKEIQKYFPFYNRALKYPKQNAYIGYYEGQDGFWRIDIFNKKPNQNIIQSFSSLVAARDFLYKIMREANLCPIFLNLQKTTENCIKGNQCRQCTSNEKKDIHNVNFLNWLENQKQKTFFIIGPGRGKEEKSLVYVENGDYRGYGFLSEDIPQDQWIDIVQFQKNDVHTKRIINEFLNGYPQKLYKIIHC